MRTQIDLTDRHDSVQWRELIPLVMGTKEFDAYCPEAYRNSPAAKRRYAVSGSWSFNHAHPMYTMSTSEIWLHSALAVCVEIHSHKRMWFVLNDVVNNHMRYRNIPVVNAGIMGSIIHQLRERGDEVHFVDTPLAMLNLQKHGLAYFILNHQTNEDQS